MELGVGSDVGWGDGPGSGLGTGDGSVDLGSAASTAGTPATERPGESETDPGPLVMGAVGAAPGRAAVVDVEVLPA